MLHLILFHDRRTAAWADVEQCSGLQGRALEWNNLVEHQKPCVRKPTKDNWKLSTFNPYLMP